MEKGLEAGVRRSEEALEGATAHVHMGGGELRGYMVVAEAEK